MATSKIVIAKAAHHGQNVKEVVVALGLAILHFKDVERDIYGEHYPYPDARASVVWVWMGGIEYTLRHGHRSHSIVIRRHGLRGGRVAEFTNATPPDDIYRMFEQFSERAA